MTNRILSVLKTPESLLFITIFLTAVFFSEIAYQTSNYTARLFLTEAIIDHGTFRLDAYEETLGVDGAIYQGHLYSNKPPGSSLIMLPQYLLLGKPVKVLFDALDINIAVQNQDYAVQDVLAGWLVQIFSLGLYTAVGFIALYRILKLLNVKRPFLLTLLSFFGTLMFPYATIGVGEMYTAPLLLLGLYHLLKSGFEADQDTAYLWAGFWYGLAFFTTNQVLLVIGVAALILLLTMRTFRPVLLFAIPIILFGLLTLGYNWLLFDHPLHFPIRYWSQGTPEVILFDLPTLSRLAEMLLLPWKGIFFYSPYLILSIPGFRHLYRHLPGSKTYRQGVVWLIAGSFLVYFIFLFFNVGWFGGADFGFRYIVPVLFYLAIGAAVFLDHLLTTNHQSQKNNIIWPLLIWFLIIWSIAINTFGAITDPEIPTGIRNPLVNYSWPLFLAQATNNVPNLLLDQLFDLNLWPLRLATTFLYFAALAYLLYRTRSTWQNR